MIKKNLIYLTITFFIILFSFIFLAFSQEEIEFQEINDSKVYIKAPYLITIPNWVEIETISKQYSGKIDFAFGFNKKEVKPVKAEYWNGTAWKNIGKIFEKINYDYKGMNTWFLKKNFNIQSKRLYKIRIYIRPKRNFKKTKYWIAFKPSSESLIEAIFKQHFHALDPYFNSWQDWNDDFEDADVNQTLWKNTTNIFATDSTVMYVREITATDGYMKMYDHNPSNGNDHNNNASLRTIQDFNDGKEYNITFEMNYTISTTNGDLAILIANGTGDILSSPQGTVLYSVGLSVPHRSPKDDYMLIINKTTAELSNSTGQMNSTLLNTSWNWYVAFRTHTKNIAGGENKLAIINIFNFTVWSESLTVTTSLESPANNTILNEFEPYFYANFTMSVSWHNITNATLYVWNNSGSLKYSEFKDLGSNTNSITTNLTADLNYTTYLWNYEAFGTDGTEVASDIGNYNFTLILNDTLKPNLTINRPTGTLTSRTIDINITTWDKSNVNYCNFTVMRGASTEIANTEITDCSNTTATVSSDGAFVIHVQINDTLNNINTSLSSFEVDTTVPTDIGAGGGGARREVEEEIPIHLCLRFKPAFLNTWTNLRTTPNWENLKAFFFSAIDYIICRSASSVVPL